MPHSVDRLRVDAARVNRIVCHDVLHSVVFCLQVDKRTEAEKRFVQYFIIPAEVQQNLLSAVEGALATRLHGGEVGDAVNDMLDDADIFQEGSDADDASNWGADAMVVDNFDGEEKPSRTHACARERAPSGSQNPIVQTRGRLAAPRHTSSATTLAACSRSP